MVGMRSHPSLQIYPIVGRFLNEFHDFDTGMSLICSFSDLSVTLNDRFP